MANLRDIKKRIGRAHSTRQVTRTMEMISTAKIRNAQERLEGSDLPVEEIGRRAGFGGAAALRHHFARAIGTSPAAYRRTFAGV